MFQVVTGTFPCRQQLVKYGYKEKAECMLCKKAHEESGSSWKGELPKETIGHIPSAGCLGQKEVVTAAHNACTRELLQEIDVHGKEDRHMKLLTVIQRESSLGTLWDQEDDDPFIVLTETKFSIRYIPVWARYSPLRTRVKAHVITLSP